MANISIYRVGELVRTVFELLWNRPDGLPSREIIAIVPEIIKLTEYEMGYSPSVNTPRYEKIIRLSTIPLVKVGWLFKDDKGRWYITEEGRNACRRFANAQELYGEALRLTEEVNSGTPEILMFLEKTQEKAWELIQKYLQERNPTEFRQLVMDLIEAMQYHITWTAPIEKNRGQIDMVVHTDPIGANTYRIIVQVKHKGQPVTLEGIKSFLGVLGKNDFGLLVSTGGFTKDAKDGLGSGTYQKINAMDLEKFFDYWVKNFENLSSDARNRLPLALIYFLSPLN